MKASTGSGVTTSTTTGASNSQLPDFPDGVATEAMSRDELGEPQPLVNAASRTALAFAFGAAFSPVARALFA
jgi:hypothetical protein